VATTTHPPRRSSPSWIQRRIEAVAQSKAGAWYFIHVTRHIDPLLLRASRGRVHMTPGARVLLITAKGARSGKPRSIPLVYVTDGDDIVLTASKGGSPSHPAWYHNLKANPEVDVVAAGRSGRYRAHEAAGPERDRLWDEVTDYYSGYRTYQQRTGGRVIPIMVLTPVDHAQARSSGHTSLE
jgi:deazaflavin-dependent oxidoreductase (nitroreductase family)